MSVRLRGIAIVLPLLLTACEWFTDFKRQPSLWTWEQVKDSTVASRGNPQMSVPTTGMAMAGYQVSYGAFPATIDSMASIANPHAVSESSLLNGRKYFSINCAVCHGDRGMGDGPATRFGMPGINLTTDMTKARSDGYIFGMIRNGRGLMPPYNRIEEPDRWDVVNYLRALQGTNAQSAGIGPLGAPGVTGDKVPGASQQGPTRPAPFFNPRAVLGQSTPSSEAAAQQGLPDTALLRRARLAVDSAAAGARADSARRNVDSTTRVIR